MTAPNGLCEGRRAAEQAARLSYGRLLAYLAHRSRDVAAAEDALADALRAAVETWPRTGVPDRPDAWLLAAARRRLVDAARHAQTTALAGDALRLLAEERSVGTAPAFPDERLRLLFACAHPALDAGAHTPLMLQTVLGLDAGRIASAFLVTPTAMGQRLVRAKATIRDARIGFAIPEAEELPARLDAVLQAIYAVYGTAWDDVEGADPRRRGLADEAIWLGRVVFGLLPREPETAGLLAMMLHCEARRTARRDGDGGYVPLDRQDVRLWSRSLIDEAERLLADAARAARPGRFQFEAAIQSVHATRAVTGSTDWPAIALLYDGLLAAAPSIGAQIGRAAALAHTAGPAAALAALDALDAHAVASYQPYWALRAHLLRREGRAREAIAAYQRAIGLSESSAVRSFLAREAAAAKE